MWNTGESSSSVIVNCEFVPNRAIATAKFASGATFGAPPLPKWRHTGRSASCAAARRLSQWSLCHDGRPEAWGLSVNDTALAPFAATRWTSAVLRSASQ